MSVLKADGVSSAILQETLKISASKNLWVRKLKRNYKVTEFWADRHVTFSLEKGDMPRHHRHKRCGQVHTAQSGLRHYGADRGPYTYIYLEINGTVAALLELASGFDGELTVRENTYLRGAMLGYTRKFMNEKYDDIIAFAELKDFQERPFKQLSSGMKSRLAFSIACLVSPDILILDEVLSVGDGSFRKKSGDKMKEILKSGVTGILVSHSIAQVRELCNKILWLDHGKQVAFTSEVKVCCDAYEEFLQTKKLPRSRGEIENLAKDFDKRLKEKREKESRTEAQKLQSILEAGKSDAAVEAALNVLRKNHPELLSEAGKAQHI